MIRILMIAAALSAAFTAAAAAEAILIQNGRVITNADAGIIEGGDVLITNGRIAAVGRNVAAPVGAAVVDARGKWVTPGVIAAMSQVGLSEIAGSGAPNDANIEGDHISAAAEAAVAFNANVSAIAVTRIEGVTHAVIAPAARGSLFAGRGAVVKLDGAPDSVVKRDAFMVLVLGEGGGERAGGSRASSWPLLAAALRDAREYPQRYRSGQGGAVLNEVDAEAVAPFARGEGLILVQIDQESDIRQLLAFARANPRLRLAIHGGAEAWRAGPELAAAQIAVILDPLANLPDRFERIGARLDNAALLHKAGVTVAIAASPGSDDAHQSRLVLQLAGNAAANGLPWEAAFAAVSRNPAAIFGMSQELGVLARGRAAHVVVWDGDPLDVTSAPTAVYIDGVATPLVSRQTRLRDRYAPKTR
jgi:imidazolonepropionase-like amidohydrolase